MTRYSRRIPQRFYIIDEREIWHEAACEAAQNHGFGALRVPSIPEGWRPLGDEHHVGFIRPHADWRILPRNRIDYQRMRDAGLTMIQDQAQIDVYEDKSEQFRRWWKWMPATWRFSSLDRALALLDDCAYPIVSKADVGASSVNVRILNTQDEAVSHVKRLFGPGISVHHGANCPNTMQRGYALLQRFIPHKITWRVNAIGDARAAFMRYCYPDKPVAQTGNVDPVKVMTPEVESLFEYADRVFADIGSKWCALDILKDGNEWKLLETSLAWPWPSPGDCDNGPIFRSGGRKWIDMFEVMFDQLEAGAWGSIDSPTHSQAAAC